MVGILAAALLVLVLAGLVAWAMSVPQTSVTGPAGRWLPPRERARRRSALAAARWTVGHDEVDGVTRVLLQRTCIGPDGRPDVLEERVFDSFPAHDPLWEARFTEAMANARFRCRYLNTEEGQLE
ncbi:hypothetical protein GCM10023328_30550 [Modestobacter marinus]|uniref:Uncharacterized protein n=1 Tax=Modestobacter marinus TaxID=477641 RepID=A0A846LFJ4_9ACTN|nr:hypothetical protein [Modestobacter marinus]NIH65981.1 hypothetical protein [Modestobacter marinus]GGL68675.1 hypothetical protein GCM10011589_26210 [Modestobacter marinus]